MHANGPTHERLGYQVTACKSPGEAIAALAATPEPFDVLVTDYAMPHMTGTQLAAEVKLRFPKLPVILVPGFPGAVQPDELRQVGISELLHKPLTGTDCACAIRRAVT